MNFGCVFILFGNQSPRFEDYPTIIVLVVLHTKIGTWTILPPRWQFKEEDVKIAKHCFSCVA